MRLSYQWLCEYVDVRDVTPVELAERLTRAGLEVDAIEPRNLGVKGVVVGEVLAVEPHPNADKLRVCQVHVGQEVPLTIVCGAANVAAGQKVPTAVPGSVLPGGSIGVAKLRGIESSGMLCSAKEIGLEVRLLPKEQTEGLYILPSDAPVGADIVAYLHLDDVVLDIGLTPNRSDCLSIRGFAYEVSALYDRPVGFPNELSKVDTSTVSPVKVRIETPLCTRYEAQVLTDVGRGSSPLWMQMRLMAMGIRPINLTVDITNYVMLEWGQPLHAFDLDEVHDRTIVVRQGRPNETLVTLDGESRDLNEETIVIADPDRAIGIAGVMGGENSEITERTVQVVLESAIFQAVSVRRTGQRLGLRSEAQQRFEKGIDPQAVRGAIFRATHLMRELSGANAKGAIVSASHPQAGEAGPRIVEFRPAYCNQLLGTEISETAMLDVFRRLQFHVDRAEGTWHVHAPSRRPDIALEADLVEEIARLVGYDNIPATLPEGPTTVGLRNPHQVLRKRTRDVLVGAGLIEAVTYSLTQPSALHPLRIDDSSPYRTMIPLMRPMSEERAVLRTHMLPSLAEVAQYNLARGVQGGQIFEVNRVYWPTALPLAEQPCERTQWAGLWFGLTEASVGTRQRPYDFYDVKGVVEVWLRAFGWMEDAVFAPVQVSWLHPGRSAEVRLGNERIGTFGELHPETLKTFDIDSAFYAEFDLDLLVQHLSEQWKVKSLPKYPASRRDLAVFVDMDVTVASLQNTASRIAKQQGKSLLESCQVFDVYTGKGVPEGQKSLAFALTYRAEDRTLTDEEITAVESTIVEAWESKFGASLRSS